MTKKDYQRVAREIHRVGQAKGVLTMHDVIDLLGNVFAEDNMRFDFERFQQACLTGTCKGMRS